MFDEPLTHSFLNLSTYPLLILFGRRAFGLYLCLGINLILHLIGNLAIFWKDDLVNIAEYHYRSRSATIYDWIKTMAKLISYWKIWYPFLIGGI